MAGGGCPRVSLRAFAASRSAETGRSPGWSCQRTAAVLGETQAWGRITGRTPSGPGKRSGRGRQRAAGWAGLKSGGLPVESHRAAAGDHREVRVSGAKLAAVLSALVVGAAPAVQQATQIGRAHV